MYAIESGGSLVKRGAISIIRLKRCFIYRPLAAILAVMMVPMFSGFGGDAGRRAFQAVGSRYRHQ
jgi:hypothetical protein